MEQDYFSSLATYIYNCNIVSIPIKLTLKGININDPCSFQNWCIYWAMKSTCYFSYEKSNNWVLVFKGFCLRNKKMQWSSI